MMKPFLDSKKIWCLRRKLHAVTKEKDDEKINFEIQIDGLLSKLRSSEEEKEDLQRRLQENGQLHTQSAEKLNEQLLEDLKVEKANMCGFIRDLQQQLATSAKNVEYANQQIALLNVRKVFDGKKIDELEAKVHDYGFQVKYFQDQTCSLASANEVTSNENSNIKRLLDETMNEHQECKAKNAAEIKALETRSNQLMIKLEASQHEVEMLELQLKDAKDEAEIKALETRSNELMIKLEDSQHKVEMLELQLKDANEEICVEKRLGEESKLAIEHLQRDFRLQTYESRKFRAKACETSKSNEELTALLAESKAKLDVNVKRLNESLAEAKNVEKKLKASQWINEVLELDNQTIKHEIEDQRLEFKDRERELWQQMQLLEDKYAEAMNELSRRDPIMKSQVVQTNWTIPIRRRIFNFFRGEKKN